MSALGFRVELQKLINRESRENGNESQHVGRTMKAIYWRLFIVRLALRWISTPNLGDAVIYQGRRWVLIQGVCDPIWSLVSGEERVEVHRDQFRKVPGLRSAWQSFRSGYRFYMTNWYGIWKREGIQPWMRDCQIWAGDPPR